MDYAEFAARVAAKNWTAEQLRCDIPPDDEILDFIEEVGDAYESFVLRFCQKGE